ncbi:MAG: hypothetical protein ACP5NZ_02705 [Nanobdellota archaeon]
MNFQFYFEKMMKSKDFKKFISENKEAFLCSGFFSVDKKGNDNKQNIDYFVPSLNKMFSFKLNDGVELVPVEDFGENFKPEKIPDNIDFEFEYIEKLIEGEMFEKKITNKIEKSLFSLQAKDKKNYLLGTIFISGLALLKVKIDLDEKRVVEFDKKSFFEMMKIVKK